MKHAALIGIAVAVLSGFMVMVAPLAIAGGSGAPTRIFAVFGAR
jgi:hypothetical protein